MKNTSIKHFHIPLFFLITISLLLQYSCVSTSVDLCDVCTNPSDYQNPMTLKGTVTESSGILGYSIFIIKDKLKDCRVMVLSKKISPSPGKFMKIKGTLKELSNIDNNRKFIFVEEGINFDEIKDMLISSYNRFLSQ